MSSKLYNQLFNQNSWNMDDIPSITYKKYIDKWDVSSVYPFKITQQQVEEYTDEHLESLAKMSVQEKMLLKMNMNSFYGTYSGITPTSKNLYYGGAGSTHHSGLKNLYYQYSKNVNIQYSRTVPHKETAKCIQKEKLITHFTHKLTKTSKKKKEYNTLSKIIEMYQSEINIYMDEFPERFI